MVNSFRGGWDNSSLIGYWTRLFDSSPNRARHLWPMQALCENPVLAWTASGLSAACVTAAIACVACRARRGVDRDLPFALAQAAMLLVTPIVREHYFLILIPSLIIAWCRLPATLPVRGLIAALVFAFSLPPQMIWQLMGLATRLPGPLDAVGLLSYQFYALLALFLLLAVNCVRNGTGAE